MLTAKSGEAVAGEVGSPGDPQRGDLFTNLPCGVKSGEGRSSRDHSLQQLRVPEHGNHPLTPRLTAEVIGAKLRQRRSRAFWRHLPR